MLFDLRGRGRRHTIQVLYIGLALLMGVGLIGFGIGGGLGGGGLFTSLNSNSGSNSASFSAQITKYEKLTRQQPGNVNAWDSLAKAQLHQAGAGAYDASGQLTTSGRTLFSQAASSWNHYITLSPPHPDSGLALEMVQVFSKPGLNQPAEAMQVLQIVVTARPTSVALWAQLAQSAYQAKNVRVGDLAAAKAVSLAPAAQRTQLKSTLSGIKKNP